jgi:hypothetical protein
MAVHTDDYRKRIRHESTVLRAPNPSRLEQLAMNALDALDEARARAEKAEALAREAGRVVVMLANPSDDVDPFALMEHADDVVEKVKALAPTTTEGGAE